MANLRAGTLGRHWHCVAILGFGIAMVLSFGLGIDSEAVAVHEGVQARGGPKSPQKQTQYVGSEACAKCHSQVYNEYSRTSMGRSMSRVTPALLSKLPSPASLNVEKLHQRLEVYTRDGNLYQSEYEVGADGKEVFRNSQQVEWIIGSGANGLGAIITQGEYLFQAPLSFYSKPKEWELSPGYEFGNYGFNRPILPGCIFCHSGQPRPVAEGNGRFKNPPFGELAIGCENCHGPGIQHVREMQHGAVVGNGKKGSIVNPAKLAPTLADNICLFCHQTGDVRVLKPGKDFSDFRPGDPLDDTLSILMVAPHPDSPPQTDHLEHYYSMTLSKCYRESGGRLGCITCHDPHVEPDREEAPAYFTGKCLSCHSDDSCKLSLEARRHRSPADDCSGCHMQKRDVGVISHSSITNHRILARPEEPFPEVAFHQTTPELPDLIHLNPAPRRKGPPPPITLLQAYGELMEKHPEYLSRYLALLDQLERTQPDNSLVQAAAGRRALRAGKLQDAAAHLQRALDIGPPRATVYGDLSETLAKLDRAGDAVPPLEKAIALDPFNSVLQRTLVLRLIQLKRYPEAKTAMEHYVERFPEDSFMRQMLARVKPAGPGK